MKREQLTNVETEARCQALAVEGCRAGKWLDYHRSRGKWISRTDYNYVASVADKIISLRSQQVTP
jgi:hypothetical protein